MKVSDERFTKTRWCFCIGNGHNLPMISHLADVPFFRDELAALHAAEWKHLYADWDLQTALAEFLN